jgi:hypothetical protein
MIPLFAQGLRGSNCKFAKSGNKVLHNLVSWSVAQIQYLAATKIRDGNSLDGGSG